MCTGVEGQMDGLRFYVRFNSISVDGKMVKIPVSSRSRNILKIGTPKMFILFVYLFIHKIL